MNRKAKSCTWLPVLPDCFCWSTLMANWPARCACIPAGGDDDAIAVRRLSTRSVTAVSSPVPTFDCTWSCAACPATPPGPGTCDWPSSRTFTTVGTLARSACRVPSQAWSAAVNDPVLTAATTGIGTVDVVNPSGAARSAACWLGALAGRNALLLPCVTLASDGSALGIAAAAAIQTISTTQRNLTANLPIARKMSSTCTRPRIAARLRPPVSGLSLFSASPSPALQQRFTEFPRDWGVTRRDMAQNVGRGGESTCGM